MRIAVWHGLPSGGGRRVLTDQVLGLVRRGHLVEVWTPSGAPRFDALDGVAATHEVPLHVPDRGRGLDDLRAAWRGRRPDLDAFLDHSEQCAREMQAFAPDVVLADTRDGYRPPAIGACVAEPSALYLHEANRRLFEAPLGAPWTASPPTRTRPDLSSVRSFVAELVRVEQARIEVRTETEWIGVFDQVLVNSSFTRESVARGYGLPSQVCAPGVDTERFAVQPRPAETRGVVLSVGALVVEKDPGFLVRAVAEAGPSIRRFVWVANYVDAACRREVERAAADAGVSFELRVAVGDDELLRCYADADLFVYAPRLEPLGLAPLEASATGLPVVAVAEGGVRETVVDGVNGVLAPADPASFADAVTALLGDPERLRALGRSAREHVVEHWSLAASIERLEARLVVLAGQEA